MQHRILTTAYHLGEKNSKKGRLIMGKNLRNMQILLLICVFLGIFCAPGYADIIERKGGGRIKGLIVEETDESVKVETTPGSYMTIKKSDIKIIKRLSKEERKIAKEEKQENLEFIKWGKVTRLIQRIPRFC